MSDPERMRFVLFTHPDKCQALRLAQPGTHYEQEVFIDTEKELAELVAQFPDDYAAAEFLELTLEEAEARTCPVHGDPVVYLVRKGQKLAAYPYYR